MHPRRWTQAHHGEGARRQRLIEGLGVLKDVPGERVRDAVVDQQRHLHPLTRVLGEHLGAEFQRLDRTRDLEDTAVVGIGGAGDEKRRGLLRGLELGSGCDEAAQRRHEDGKQR